MAREVTDQMCTGLFFGSVNRYIYTGEGNEDSMTWNDRYVALETRPELPEVDHPHCAKEISHTIAEFGLSMLYRSVAARFPSLVVRREQVMPIRTNTIRFVLTATGSSM